MDFAATGYNTFIAGDRGITQLVNHDIDDDSCCVLVKDSYGNPFAVWLTQLLSCSLPVIQLFAAVTILSAVW